VENVCSGKHVSLLRHSVNCDEICFGHLSNVEPSRKKIFDLENLDEFLDLFDNAGLHVGVLRHVISFLVTVV
jgi:hypothetical protein